MGPLFVLLLLGGLQGSEGVCKPRDCYSAASLLQTCDQYTSMLRCMRREYDGCSSNADHQSVISAILAIRRKPFCGWDLQKITVLMTSRSDLVSSLLRRSDGTAMLALGGDGSFDDDDNGPFNDDNSKDDDHPFDDNSKDEHHPFDDNSKDDDHPFDDDNSKDDDHPFDDDNSKDDDHRFDDDNSKNDDHPVNDNSKDDDHRFDDDNSKDGDHPFDDVSIDDDGPFDDMGHRGLLPSRGVLPWSPGFRYTAAPSPAPGIITDSGGAMMVRGSSSRHAYSGSSSAHITLATVLSCSALIRFAMRNVLQNWVVLN